MRRQFEGYEVLIFFVLLLLLALSFLVGGVIGVGPYADADADCMDKHRGAGLGGVAGR